MNGYFLGKDAPETSYPKMIHEAEEAEKEILVWLLKMLLKPTADGLYNSWLSYVLYHKEFRLSGFLDCYVCAAADAATELDTKQTGLFTAERKKGLSELGVENARNEIEAFISMSSGIQTEQIAPWLNNGTESEKTELIARVGREKLNVLPAAYYDVYHEFFVYMTDYDLDNEELDHYFRDYRMAKLHDFVSPALYEKAATLDVLDLVESRDVCVQKYCNDPDTALLFVDGFGVEYVPLLYALMTKYISSCEICHANIPTITETNAIQWPSERRIDPIDRVDKVGHFGSGSGKSVASSLYAVLDVVERMICPCVIRGLKEYKRVLLTADHGSSRLVVTAHNQGVSKSLVLPPSARPADWRYTQAIPGQPVPAGSRANFSETYWAVCGYDRFPQSGGREYEVHGGITPEEVLVPVVLFQNDGQHLFGKKKTACKSEFALDTVFDEFDL
ncbi:MAG: BREX-4 system phosphatase PglZ [Thermoguttaceae bacterium]|nr:BREX-4 system phosphatase PglZ [Thermoguttaceae bacterium]